MKINKTELLAALEAVKPGLSNKELIEQTTSFAFIKGSVVTYNDEISISHPIKGMDLEGAVQAEQLYKLLAKIKKEEIEIIQEANELRVESGKMKAGLTLQKEISLPLEETGGKKEWYPVPAKLLRHMKIAVGACSRDMSRPKLTCVHISKKGFVEGSDGFRIVQCVLGEELMVKSFLLPAGSVGEVIKIDPIEIAEGSGWVHFRNVEKTILSCRILTEDYFDIDKFLDSTGEPIKFPSTMNELLDRAGVFSKRDFVMDESVEISLGGNKLTIKSKSDTGWFTEEVNCKYAGKEITFAVTPYLLKDILNEMKECTYKSSSLFFQAEDWCYLSMLRKS